MRAGRPSSTALLIARSTVVASRHAGWRHLFDPRAVQLCEQFVRDHLRLAAPRLWLYRRGAYRKAAAFVEARTLPGLQLHYALRKKWIEESVRSALEAGFRNVQITGAGFDTLATRLAEEREDVRFLEVDHPDTQRCKRASLEKIGVRPPNLSFRSSDLGSARNTANAPDALDAGQATIVVAEGLLMYLTTADVRRFFADLHQNFRARLRIIFTFMAPDAAGRMRFHNASRLVDRWLDFHGEPFTWGIPPAGLGDFLRSLGFELLELVGHDRLRARYLPDGSARAPEPARGEMLAAAEAVR